MKKTTLLSIIVVAVQLTIGVVEAQQPARIPQVGWLGARPAPSSGQQLWRDLRELGYVEGKNVAIEFRYADNKPDRLPALADELVRLKVDVLVTPGVSEALAAKKATKTIPIVFLIQSDPVAAGLIDGLARPGGNITGFTTIAGELAGKRLELLKETVPKVSRVALLRNPQGAGAELEWKESQLAARVLGLQLYSMEVVAPTGTKVHLKRRLKRVAPLLP